MRPRGRPRRQVVSSEHSEVISNFSDSEYTVAYSSNCTVKTQPEGQVRSPYNIRRKNLTVLDPALSDASEVIETCYCKGLLPDGRFIDDCVACDGEECVRLEKWYHR